MKTHQFTIVIGSDEFILQFAPIGWDSRNRSFVRSDDGHGVFTEFTADLTFIKDGFALLKNLWEIEGVNSVAYLRCEKFNNKTNQYVEISYSKFDFTTYAETTENGNGVKISLTDNEFSETFKARKTVEVPYDRLETIDGNTIVPFPYHDTVWETLSGEGATLTIGSHDVDGYRPAEIYGIDVADKGIELTIDDLRYSSDGSARNVVMGISTNYQNPSVFEVANRQFSGARGTIIYTAVTSDCFFYTDGNAKVSYNINMILQHRSDMAVQPNTWQMYVVLYKAKFDKEGVPQPSGFDKLFEVYSLDREFNYLVNQSGSVDLEPLEGLLLYAYFYANNLLGYEDSYMEVKSGATLTIDFSEKFGITYPKGVLPHEAFTRVVESITGVPNSFYSPVFGRTDLGYDTDGEFAYWIITNGLLIRGFPQGYKISETDTSKVAQLKFTFDKLFKSFDAYCCLGWGIDYINGELKIIVDYRSNFYSEDIIAELPPMQIRSFSKEFEPKLVYNEAMIGTEVAEYKELSGLEEYNGVTKYATSLKPIDNKLDLIAEYKNSCYSVEYARRKQYLEYQTTDTQYDDIVQIIALTKNNDGNLIQLTTEGFEIIEGIPLVSTPMNLDISPARCLLRHGRWLNSGLYKFPTQYLKFSSSTFATGLGTKKTGEDIILYENGDILNASLGHPQLSGMVIKCNISVTDNLWTEIIANKLGIFKFIDQITGQIIYGALKSITSEPVRNEPTNVELWEAFPPDIGTIKVLAFDDDSVLEFNDGSVNEMS